MSIDYPHCIIKPQI